MNKILIDKDIINNYQDSLIKIDNNNIIFKQNGEYELEFIDCKDINFTLELEDNVYIKLFIYSDNNNIEVKNHIVLNEKSNLLLFKFYSNKDVKEEIKIDLNKKYAKVNYCFSNIASSKENYHLIINHNASDTISNVSNKSITTLDAKLDFTIDSNVIKNTSKCILNQTTRIITMDKNNATVRPNMFIDKYDVEAKHASVIGKFKEEDIFYLMTRGIDKNDAIKLLIKGFIFSNLIVDMDKRAKILNIINTKWR